MVWCMATNGGAGEENKCCLCGGSVLPPLADVADSLTGDRFSIARCSQCGVGQTVPSPDDLGRFYRSYHGNRHGITAGYRIWRRIRLLKRIAGDGRGKRLLDVGCGDGGFLRAAQRLGWQVSGTELEPQQARSLGLDVRAEIDDFRASEKFDCVTFWHSLEHLPRPHEALRQARERLQPGGVLLVSVPDAGGWQARLFGRHWLHLDVPRHLFHFNRPSLARLLETTGFVLVGHWHHEIEYDLIGWSQSALNLVAAEPNIFLHSLIRRPVRAGRAARATHLVLGAILSGAALPLVAVSSCLGRGGTLIVAAKPVASVPDAGTMEPETS
ncbi:MAG: hypothetical protein B7Z73_00475 [Planctomycetia bacterium 21-64-5]|nr:MAG: hypothetical protein B7Z73_00475 [Planctomycetia bacterium 21-64-5]